ncbi:MAG: PIG-L deacetylase family protein [Candidatus Thorarchaeota archaeon]
MKILILAPHPDDEVLGVGGTIAKHSHQGDEVAVTVVSEGVSAQYTDPKMKNVRRKACKDACHLLGVETINFYDLPDAKLMDVGIVEITKVINESIQAFKPDIIYAPHISELHMDHRMVYEATLVVTRPYLDSFLKKSVYFYETSVLKCTSFNPNYYVDISEFIDMKIDAFKAYQSEIEEFPHPRSFEAIRTIAKQRGAESGVLSAEGFVIGRQVW